MPSNRKQIAKLRSKEEEEVNILANRYIIQRKLGSGSFGTVFLISDLKNKESIKVLKKIHIGDLKPDETIGAITEAQLLSKLDHPGIVKFHDSFVDKEFFCIITEFCEGGDLEVKLHTWRKSGKPPDKTLTLTWFVQLVLAVQYMHQRRVLHRDLKSRNIFLKNNMVKIGDFGISRILQGSTDVATTFTGTPYFMAPEILKHEGYNSKSDIWSLGVILYEMCSLKKAFQGGNLMDVMMKIVNGIIPKLPERIDNELHHIYESMLCRDPANRLSATEILKKSYIIKHLEKLKMKLKGDRTIDRRVADQEAMEIARVLTGEKVSKNKKYLQVASNERPLTPKEQMKIRKQQRADEELERLKKLTVKTYNESRRRCTDIKHRLEHGSAEETHTKNNEIQVNISEATSDVDQSLDVYQLPSDDVFDREDKVERARAYTHCFGEEDETHIVKSTSDVKEPGYRKYTHCFGGSSSEDEEKDNEKDIKEDNQVFEETLTPLYDSLELTDVSEIPEDADLADTYYSTYDDFEDEEDDGNDHNDNDEYGALVGYMENALEMTDGRDSTFDDDTLTSDNDGTSIRQEKIDKLKKECVRLLGEDGFQKVYHFLSEVRFDPSRKRKMSEDAIMKRLRQLVGSSRDCFLVDQLLFLEKQNQIFQETF